MTQIEHREQPPVPVPPARADEPRGSSAIRLVMLVLVVAWVGIAGGVSWLAILFALVTVIFLHELGHYVTARWAGMKVTEFFIGFGPRIWSFHRGETEYGIKAIPAGAYVKVIGMTNLEEVAPEDEARTYRQKSYWRRMSVAVAGSAMHFVIAIVAMFSLLVGYGTTEDDIWEVGRLAQVEADGGGAEPGPASLAGIRVGDEIVSIDGRPVTTFDDVRDAMATSEAGDEVVIQVARSGDVIDMTVTLGDNGEGAGFLGIGPYFPTQDVGVVEGVPMAVTEFGRVGWQSIGALASFFSPSGIADFVGIAADTASTGREPGGTSAATAAESGENRVLSIYGAARLGQQAADTGLESFLGFMVIINVFIGVFNLVPLLPLDGGHVAVATYEKLRELAARRRERYHADVAKLLPLTYLVVFFLVSVGLVALYLDIADPINL